MSSENRISIAELFAGVGGFRLGLEGYEAESDEFSLRPSGPFETIWANQWEPPGTQGRQFAARCYEARFGEGSVINEDINKVLDEYEAGSRTIPAVEMVVGGFPCQDYSVARTLSQAGGIEGKKGVLWWDIHRFLKIQIGMGRQNARFCLFENVDRLLKSPASQRGRDFAIILSCLAELGYAVEWRVVNSAEYGFSQRRKRIYIFAERGAEWNLESRLHDGVMATAFPFEAKGEGRRLSIPTDIFEASQSFGKGCRVSPFMDAGVLVGNEVKTCSVVERYDGPRQTLGDVLVPEADVPETFYVPDEQLDRWEYLKGSKREERVNKSTGFTYFYSEGSMAWPDLLENPSRTILTGEGGPSPSRFKHVIRVGERYRRLVPDELDRLQGFPRGWTDTGMSNNNRAFCMGNALVVGVVSRIGRAMSRLYGL